MKIAKPVACAVSIALLSACTEPNGEPGRGIENGGNLSKQDVGTAVGVVGGGLVGSAFGAGTGNTLAILGGALLGGILGNQIGHSMDNADRAAYDRASQQAMETGQARTWHHNGHHGTIVPHKGYTNDEGQYCREYTQTIYIDGKQHKAHGKACRDDDGVWRVDE